VAQEPNIELDGEVLPRQGLPTAPPRRWSPHRPGELRAPEEVPWGGAFGRPGPDTGWVLRLVHLAEFDRGDRPEELEEVVSNVAAARASLYGRAPVPQDIEVALVLLGLRPHQLPPDLADRLALERRAWLDRAAHEKVKGTAFIAAIDPDRLRSTPEEVVEHFRTQLTS
jgi:hypothetical protein